MMAPCHAVAFTLRFRSHKVLEKSEKFDRPGIPNAIDGNELDQCVQIEATDNASQGGIYGIPPELGTHGTVQRILTTLPLLRSAQSCPPTKPGPSCSIVCNAVLG